MILLKTYIKPNFEVRDPIDVDALCLQYIRALRGVMLFLLTMRCVTVLGVNRTLATSATLFTRSLSNLVWPTVNT